MPDPFTGAAVVKAAVEGAKDSASEATPGLVIRILGPAADEIGEAIRRWTAYRVGNVQRIAIAAGRKSDNEKKKVHPRVAYEVLDRGSFCDDELMAEYYGGLLAAARTPDGRDDRAVTWSAVVSSMSSIQLRAHYLLYREWAARLHGSELNLGAASDRLKAQMDIDMVEFIPILSQDAEIPPTDLMNTAIVGLARVGLLEVNYTYGPRGTLNAPDSPYEYPLRVFPTVAGFELYGWAQGLAGLSGNEFAEKAVPFEIEDHPLPRLTRVILKMLNAIGPDDTSAATGVTT